MWFKAQIPLCRLRRFPRFPDANGLVADLLRELVEPSRHVAMFPGNQRGGIWAYLYATLSLDI